MESAGSGKALRRSRWIGLIAGIAILAAPNAASAQQSRDITICLASGALTIASVRIANEMGFYKKYNISPKFVVMDTGSAAMAALIGGSCEVAAATPGDLLAAQASGQKLVATTNLYRGLSATLVLSKKAVEKLGVAQAAPPLERLKAINGLMIALPSPTAYVALAFKIGLKAAGVDVRSTYIAAANMEAAFESGAIDGFVTSAPFWISPVVKGTGVVWVSGPRGEFPADAVPAGAAAFDFKRAYAEANPDIVKGLASVIADLGKALDERPADVKAATAKLYPTVNAATIDLFFEYESASWKAPPLTANDMARDIDFVKRSGVEIPQLDTVDPKSLILP